jgi:hypothetical protein
MHPDKLTRGFVLQLLRDGGGWHLFPACVTRGWRRVLGAMEEEGVVTRVQGTDEGTLYRLDEERLRAIVEARRRRQRASRGKPGAA